MMNYEGADTEITVYWWNLGTKTLDYRGPIKGFLIKKGIKVRKLKAKDKYDSKWKFTISTGSSTVTLIIHEPSFFDAAKAACLIHMTLMQDKATFNGLKVNWR